MEPSPLEIVQNVYFGNLILYVGTLAKPIILLQNDLLTKQDFSKIVFWQNDILGVTLSLKRKRSVQCKRYFQLVNETATI